MGWRPTLETSFCIQTFDEGGNLGRAWTKPSVWQRSAERTRCVDSHRPRGLDYPIPDRRFGRLDSIPYRAGVNAIVAQKGVVSTYAHLCQGTSTGMVVHYSVSTRHAGPESNNKVLVGHADETLPRGGIGVSSQVNMGSEREPEMIQRMGELNRQAPH